MNMALSNVTIMQILVFLAVAEEKGFAKAANLLHITQPAVSKSIAKLEQELDIRLFQRSTRSLELTECGLMLYDSFKGHVYGMQSSFQSAYSFASQKKEVIHIALINTTDPARYFNTYVERFRQSCPSVTLEIVNDSLENQKLFLSQNKYDIIFIPDFEHYDLDRLNLPWKWAAKSSAQIIMSKNHPLAAKKSLSLNDIKEESYIIIDDNQNPNYLEYLKEIYQPLKMTPNIGKKYYSTSAVHSISEMEGILLVDDFFVLRNQNTLVKRPLEGYENGIICTWNKPFRTNYIKKFIDVIEWSKI